LGGGEPVALDDDVAGLDDLVQGGAVAAFGGGADELERHNGAPFSQVRHQHAGATPTAGAGCARLRGRTGTGVVQRVQRERTRLPQFVSSKAT
ncbi:hypothetical protein ADL26_19550, partial [Thermoactinomyces vulgaris]